MKVDFSFYFAIIFSVLTGQVQVFVTYLIAIFIHEAGHLILASLFGWRVNHFRLTGIGCFLSFDNDLVKPEYQKMIVALGGIFFNLLFAAFLIGVGGPPSLLYSQYAIVLFNLFPISPLDGSKILQAALNLFFDYKHVLEIMKVTNVVFLFLFAMFVFTFRLENYFLVVLMLAVFVGRFHASVAYLYARYQIQCGTN